MLWHLGRLLLLTLAAFSWLVSCQPSEHSARTKLTVFAASSLTESFEALARKFEARHAGVDVELMFAGSQILRLQIEQGAAADVFASANEAHVKALRDAELISDAHPFARNELVVATPKNNPAQIESFEQLDRAKRLVIGSENVPVGIYARDMLRRAGKAQGAEFLERVHASVVSEESNVRLLRAKVELGEADAAIVYRTDTVSSTKVRALGIPKEINVHPKYVIGIVSQSAREDLARLFVAFVLSEDGTRTLTEHGFSPPDP